MSLTTSFPYIFHTLFIKDLNLITYNDILKMTYFNAINEQNKKVHKK